MRTRAPNLHEGLKHRCISALLPLLVAPIFAVEFGHSTQPMALAPVAGLLLGSVSGFLRPLVLTKGLNRPFPNAAHLALVTASTQRLMVGLSLALLALPSAVRLASRFWG